MAKYDKDTKFYWLQLKEDFFDEDAIQWLEEQKPNGKEYAYFYLKLCLKSLKNNGILIRKVGEILLPYDNTKLSEITRTDFDTVTIAMGLLQKIGLVKILENGEIYLTQVEQMIGSKSKGAFKKQQQRLSKISEEDKCPPKCPPKIELELEIEKELNNIYNTQFEKFYKSYPRKVSKSVVQKWFEKNKPDEDLFNNIMSSLEAQKKVWIAKRTETQYIPHPSTWLNQKRWQDEIESVKSENTSLEDIQDIGWGNVRKVVKNEY